MTKKEMQTSATYDAMYEAGGFGGAYSLPYWRTWFYPLYKAVIGRIRSEGAQAVLEVGCGSGALAHMLLEYPAIRYKGFDFSEEAVRQAMARTGRGAAFWVADALSEKSYDGVYDCIVCTEVLEHIDEDLKVISLWKPGTFCLCSVPNFDASTHVRHFLDESAVEERYSSLIAIDSIARVRKPAIPDISISNRLCHIWWNRYRPKRLTGLMGLGSFAKMGGWFVFSGRRTS